MEQFDHQQHYFEALAKMEAHAEDKYVRGWMQYAREKHPALYEKYMAALKQINALWKKDDPDSIESWKRAVQSEIDGTRYFIDRYQEYLENNPPLVFDEEDMSKEARGFELEDKPVQRIGVEVIQALSLDEAAALMNAYPDMKFECSMVKAA